MKTTVWLSLWEKSSCELKVHYDLKKTMFRLIQKYFFSQSWHMNNLKCVAVSALCLHFHLCSLFLLCSRGLQVSAILEKDSWLLSLNPMSSITEYLGCFDSSQFVCHVWLRFDAKTWPTDAHLSLSFTLSPPHLLLDSPSRPIKIEAKTCKKKRKKHNGSPTQRIYIWWPWIETQQLRIFLQNLLLHLVCLQSTTDRYCLVCFQYLF